MKAKAIRNRNRYNEQMTVLSSRLDRCASFLVGTVLYLDYPIHDNVGDLLIWLGTQRVLKRNNVDVIGAFNYDNVGQRARRLMKECTTICFHGGGNLGDLWPWFQKFREEIISRFPDKRIVILPQSVHFSDADELRKACVLFKEHPDLHIFLRDRRSFALLEAEGLGKIHLCPDMAHALWGSFDIKKSEQAEPLYLLRRDHEKSALPANIPPQGQSTFDWPDLLTGRTRFLFKIGIYLNKLDAFMGNNLLPIYRIWGYIARYLVRRSADLFDRHDTIVTNRLHAVILSAMLGRKSVAFDNSYGKLSTYIDCWMSDVAIVKQSKL